MRLQIILSLGCLEGVGLFCMLIYMYVCMSTLHVMSAARWNDQLSY